MHPTLRRARPLLIALAAAFALAAFAACDGDDGEPASPLPATPTATATPAAPGDEPIRTPSPDDEAAPIPDPEPDRQVRDLLLNISLGLSGTTQRADVDAVAVPLDGTVEEAGYWFSVSTGPGVAEILGERAQVSGVFQRRATGGWVQVDGRRLESTPTTARVELIDGVGLPGHYWIAVFGQIAGAGTTFELLRFDGAELSSQLWWYSPAGEAARLVDLDGDGRPELVMDASDPSILCQGCGVIDHQEVIYYWAGGLLRAVELAPLDREGELAEIVAEGVAQARAGLWREAASTLSAASAMTPTNAEARWMAILASRISDARLRRAGAAAQPLLTHVLAGEYNAAVELMRGLAPVHVFNPTGPLIENTDAEQALEVMGELLVDHASRAIAYDPELAEAYAVRALGRFLIDPNDLVPPSEDIVRAVELAPDDQFYTRALEWFEGELGPIVTPSPTPSPSPTPTATAEPDADEED
jgi:hypothetical protein